MRNLCECIDTYVHKYTWPKLRGVAMCVCVRACEKKKTKTKKKRNLILKPFHRFCENLHHRKFPAIWYMADLKSNECITSLYSAILRIYIKGGSRIDCRGGLSIPSALARAKFYVLCPLLTSFPHTTCYTKKK